MTHFVGLGIIPNDEAIEINPDYSKKEQNLENMFTMGEAGYFPRLDNMLAPYSEQSDEYCETELEENGRLSSLLTNYVSYYQNNEEQDRQNIIDYFAEEKSSIERRMSEATKWNSETKEDENYTTLDIAERTEPIDMLLKQMLDKDFSISSESDMEQLCVEFGNSSLWAVENKDNKVVYYDQYLYNPNAKWDWYEVGGRWDKMINGDSNILYDLSELLETKMIPFIQTLSFFQTLGYDKGEKVVKDHKRDENGKFLEDEEGKYIVSEYYTEEELQEKVEVPKFNFHSIISEQFGWVEEAQMGWFGMSSKDTEDDKEKKLIEEEWNNNIKEIIEYYSQQKDEKGNNLYIGVVVDFHI